MKLRQCFYAALAALLLFAQQGSLLHAVTHVPSQTPAQHERQLPHSKVCDKCIAYAEFGSALNSANPILLLADFGAVLAGDIPQSFFTALLHAFSSRAPPAFL
ncbi:MAG TPA: hypothetical protein VHE58_07945 [Burkholderiales bacterium]|nr:hypothetical protein [Burkholderiales bacterium]